MARSETLAHYDPNAKMTVTADASSYNLGAVRFKIGFMERGLYCMVIEVFTC